MATILSFSSNLPTLNSRTTHHCFVSRPIPRYYKFSRFQCAGENPTTDSATKTESVPENALLKVAWNASELLGIATSFFRSPKDENFAEEETRQLKRDGWGSVDRAVIVQTIKEDFERSYFVTGYMGTFRTTGFSQDKQMDVSESGIIVLDNSL